MSEPPEEEVEGRLEGAPTQEAGLAAAVNPVVQLQRLVAGALQDLHAIAEGVRVLPEAVDRLASIQKRVDVLNGEVKRMREGVESIGTDVVGMRGGVDPLEGELRGIRERMDPMERNVDEMRASVGRLEPIGRLADRIPRRLRKSQRR